MRPSALVAVLCSATAAAAGPPADLILRGGDILTQDPARPHARALAVRDGLIVALDDAATALAGPKTRVIELQGRAVVPALTDAHAHLVNLGLARNQVELRGCRSAADCAGRIARDRHRRGAWTLGRGWDQNLFPDGKFPTHAALDALPGPVWVRRVDGHAGWANAAALRAAGLTRASQDPPGGKGVRDPSGAPTGIFVDNAMSLIDRAVPAPSPAEIEAAILRGQELALAEGLTEVHEMGIPLAYTDVYKRLAARGRLHLRVYAYGAQDQAARIFAHPPAPSKPGAFFTLRGLKIYADGALGSRGAALLAPYSDDPGNRGLVLTGAPLAFGSDFPVEEVSVVDGFRAAVERAGWSDGEQLTLDETLRAFTTGAAFAAFEEGWRGRGTEGLAADLTVFDRPAADLVHARVDATLVGGKIVYQRR